MSLDQNLFTLLLTPNKDHPQVLDLVDPSGIVHYRKRRIPGTEYKMEVYDPMSEALLITASAPSTTSKVKILELHNPTSVVELKYTGTLSFRWAFKWEEHEFEWKREECFMLRKPDPPVLVAVTREPTGRLKTTSVQVLDYNLNRFDIDDRKGLEIVLLTALLSFQDANESYHSRDEGSVGSLPMNAGRSSANPSTPLATELSPPPPPPRPAPKTGVDRIAEMQAIKGEYNEIVIEEEGPIQDYAQYCSNLLEDDAMLFITVKSAEALQVPKVLQVVEETKRIRHRAGLSDDEELHQYVLYDTVETKKGPKRIVLDDTADKAKNKYKPPESLAVHLSKISMPELQPKATINDKSSKDPKKKDRREEKKAANLPPPSPVAPSRAPNKLTRPSASSASSQPKVHAHQVHPHQPSPSPSQLNNPGIYTAPPPWNPSTRPGNAPVSMSFPTPSMPPPNGWHPQHGRHASYETQNGPNLYGSHAPYASPASAHPSGGQAPPPWQSPSQNTQHSSIPSNSNNTPSLSLAGILDMIHRR
ncbi:hypothetical protein BDQ12DRAFT_681557 [Crucibulum laeve]|uniref:Uncharacterized protein n=1 Tax=Crucibulum laeve TaxID=68775 RepID=A0A5C3M6H7_9AGAR|nr:hypothetical protein BDQ12DRAFT_681557 [Crucibulum laeve]